MEPTTFENYSQNKVRSAFLTVICVLTFIGSGWGCISAVRSYLQADTISATTTSAIEKAQDKIAETGNQGFLKSMMSSASHGLSAESIRLSAILQLLSCLLTLGGAIMMWNLKKTGFYLYIAGIVVLVASPLLVVGPGFIGIMGAISAAIMGVAFIAMYGANLKDMTA